MDEIAKAIERLKAREVSHHEYKFKPKADLCSAVVKQCERKFVFFRLTDDEGNIVSVNNAGAGDVWITIKGEPEEVDSIREFYVSLLESILGAMQQVLRGDIADNQHQTTGEN